VSTKYWSRRNTLYFSWVVVWPRLFGWAQLCESKLHCPHHRARCLRPPRVRAAYGSEETRACTLVHAPPTPRTVRACRAPAIMFGMPTRCRRACITGPPRDVLSRAYGYLVPPGTYDGLSAAHVHVILVTLDDRTWAGLRVRGPGWFARNALERRTLGVRVCARRSRARLSIGSRSGQSVLITEPLSELSSACRRCMSSLRARMHHSTLWN
jgi:hypothetical protein